MKLRIAQIAPIVERVPPKKYGGTERVVSTLTEELVRRGHDVTLFATKDSITQAKLEGFYPRALREARVDKTMGYELSAIHSGKVYDMQDKFDIIHDHNLTYGAPLGNLSKTPTVITLHGLLKPSTQKLIETFKNPYYVSISKDQIKYAKNIEHVETIPNGLELKKYPFSAVSKGYILYVGRISLIKGTHIAIDVAQALNIPLIIAAKVDKVDEQYFKEYIEPRLYNGQVKWIGEVDTKERNKLMSEALCLINPITWREPFGLTMIEAMACGCPVVAFDNGSISEVMENGKTGFVVKDDQEMMEAILNLDKIDRKYCREYALKNFNEKVMGKRYEELYKKIILERSLGLKKNNIFENISNLQTATVFA